LRWKSDAPRFQHDAGSVTDELLQVRRLVGAPRAQHRVRTLKGVRLENSSKAPRDISWSGVARVVE